MALSRVSCTSITAWCDGCWRRPGCRASGTPPRPSKIDAYLAFIRQSRRASLTLTASRLYVMAYERGYRGSPDHFRHLIACHRPRPKAEAYLRCGTLPGAEGQVDWGHFGHLEIGRARRPLMAFVMVLSYSRQIFLRFFLDARMENFLRGHVAAFEAWQGVPRVLLYDNLKSAVLERRGDAIRFHPTLLGFAGHYRYEPRPVAVARGNEKGRVERAIRYVRDAFFAARTFADLDDLNAQAEAWCNTQAADRRCPEDLKHSVRGGVRRGSAAPAAAAGQPGAAARTGRGIGRPRLAARSQRLFGAAHARSSRADGARRSAEGYVSSTAARCSPAIGAATTATRRSSKLTTSRR